MTDATTTTEAGPTADRYDEAAREAAVVDLLQDASRDLFSPSSFGSNICSTYSIGAQIAPLTAQRFDLHPAGVRPEKMDEGDRERTMRRARNLGMVERRLVELNRAAELWWEIYQDSGRKEDEADRADPPERAKRAMAEMAATHAVRIMRENLIRAMALPGSSPRELGLQARLVALELREWWDDNKQQDGELACRALLDRLMACAGVERICDTRDVAPAEVRDWLTNPNAHVMRYNPELREGRV